MQNQYATQSATLGINADDVRTEDFRGSEHVVAPVTLVREMVLKGEMLPFEEIEATQLAWNAKPGTISHPRNDAGDFVPASAPAQFESHVTGRLFDVEVSTQTRTLEGEIWIDRDRSATVADALDRDDPAEMLLDGETVEVSVGYWYQRFEADGEFDDDEFDAVQVGIQPDHLALLPNAEGECSIEDGCGAGRDDAAGAAMQRGLLSSPWAALQQAGGKLGLNFGAGCAECGGSCDSCDDGGEQTANNGDGHDTPDDTDDQHMSNRIDDLAERTAFEADTLDDMDDAQLDALEATLEDAPDGDGTGDGGDADANTAANDADDDTDDDPVLAEIQSLRQEMATEDDLEQRFEEFRKEQTADERDALVSQVCAQTGDAPEDYEDWSLGQLEQLAENIGATDGVYAGAAGARATGNNDAEDIPVGVSLDRLDGD